MVPRSPVPLVADVHFHHEMALAALDAGVHGLRLNPGNLRKPEEIKQIAAQGTRPRSTDPHRRQRRLSPPSALRALRGGDAGGPRRVGADGAGVFRGGGFRRRQDLGQGVERPPHDRCVPACVRDVRPSSPPRCHRGGASAGGPAQGNGGNGDPSRRGIGDTIRYSLTADPVEEARAGRQLLEALGLRERKGLDLIACPSCGRAEIDVIGVAKQVQEALEERSLPIQVAVMGCVVNGPGKAREADLGSRPESTTATSS